VTILRASGHLHSTTTFVMILFQFNTSLTVLEGALFLIGAMLLDGDFFVSKFFFKIPNHRNFITHAPLLYVILLPLTYLVNPILVWLTCGAIFHLLFDVFDWGLPLKPTTMVTPHILQVPPITEEKYFFKAYYSNKNILFIEGTLLLCFILSLLVLQKELVYFALFIELFVISENIYQYSKIHMGKGTNISL